MASDREKAAAKAGLSLKDYLKTDAYKSAKKAKDSSKSQKKEEKTIKKYYDQKESDIKNKAKTDTTRLQQDLQQIMADAGISKTRATEDYIRNVGNINDNKDADVSDLNEYVKTNTGRTQEDLDTSLLKESRRYAIEYDKTNQNLADTGMTFSERKQETIDKQTADQNTSDINTVASRSFQDISRYEAVKNRDIELSYGQQLAGEETKKARTLEDILNAQDAAALRNKRAQEDVATGKAIDIRNNDYAETGALSDTSNFWDKQRNTQNNNIDQLNFNG